VSTLYRRVLGEAFDRLPPVLHRFHGLPDGGSLQGVLRVTRGSGRIRGNIADLLGLPVAGEPVRLQLQVVVEDERERWMRRFDGVPVETVQWESRGLLIEATGIVKCAYRVEVAVEGMTLHLVHAWLGPLPLPRFLTPRIEAVAMARGRAWWVQARIAAPFLGLLAQYEGEVVPEC
jgi:hypothetical protein